MADITGIINANNAKWSKLHIFFFYLFLFSIPFQTRKVFLTQYSFYSGAFTEYATFFIYASDIFLILALFFWFISIKHKTESITHLQKQTNVYFSSFIAKNCLLLLSHIRARNKLRQESTATINYDSCAKTSHKAAKSRKIQLFLFLFIVWLIINTIINNNYLEISAFQIIKFIELFLLLAYIYFNLINKKILLTNLFVISLAGFLQSIIAIYQFIFQHSLFNSLILTKITGETAIGPQIPGIAKIIVDGEKMIRAYGTFPHSNVLGGFLIFSIIISIYLLLEHKCTILSRYKLNYVRFYNIKFKKSQVQLLVSFSWIIIVFIQITALLFTFSRSAWAGFVISMIVLIFLLYIKRFSNVSRETFYNRIEKSKLESSNNPNNVSRETLIEFKGDKTFSLFPSRSSLSTEKYDEKVCNSPESSAERLQRGRILLKLLLKNLNILPKQEQHETISSSNYTNKHNLELQDNRNVSRETFLNFKRKLNCYFLAIFAAFLFIGFFDHYFWTLQQGKLIFWLVLGVLLIDMRVLPKKD